MKTYSELVEENAALAAHVERLQSAVRAAETPSGIVHVCETWMIDTHQASLARLKAQWQAEAVEAMCIEIQPLSHRCASILASKAGELRRQAEADQ